MAAVRFEDIDGLVEIACHGFAPDGQVAGLLGGDFFVGLRLVIDYDAGTVELSESAGPAEPG